MSNRHQTTSRRGRLAWLVAGTTLACNSGPGPDAMPRGAPDFRGTIVQELEDVGYVVDDGSATACGFAVVRLGDATEVWWRIGRRATPDDLRPGRLVSIWQRGDGAVRCSTVEARVVVIEGI